jgi:hypothetical protein
MKMCVVLSSLLLVELPCKKESELEEIGRKRYLFADFLETKLAMVLEYPTKKLIISSTTFNRTYIKYCLVHSIIMNSPRGTTPPQDKTSSRSTSKNDKPATDRGQGERIPHHVVFIR